MKLGTCVINFILLNVLVGKLYRRFLVRKLVGVDAEESVFLGLTSKQKEKLLPRQEINIGVANSLSPHLTEKFLTNVELFF
jgi:hypothetical protein